MHAVETLKLLTQLYKDNKQRWESRFKLYHNTHNYHPMCTGKVTGQISQYTWVRYGRPTAENSTVMYCIAWTIRHNFFLGNGV